MLQHHWCRSKYQISVILIRDAILNGKTCFRDECLAWLLFVEKKPGWMLMLSQWVGKRLHIWSCQSLLGRVCTSYTSSGQCWHFLSEDTLHKMDAYVPTCIFIVQWRNYPFRIRVKMSHEFIRNALLNQTKKSSKIIWMYAGNIIFSLFEWQNTLLSNVSLYLILVTFWLSIMIHILLLKPPLLTWFNFN